jgi:signal transduction histidine kinase
MARGNGAERIYNVKVSGSLKNSEIGPALIVTLDDVTVQKDSEQHLFELEKFADKGRMASSIAHEINNFLGLLLGGVELAELAIENGDHDRARTTLGRLKETVGQMDRFTAGLTRSARYDVSKRMANLNVVIGDVLSFLSVQKRFKNVIVSNYLDSGLPEFEMDVDRMAQLILNLMNNAADAIGATQEGAGEIVIKTAHDHGDAVLIVSDDGVGIDPDVRKKLFKSHLTTKESGHGYGLMACARIVEDHQGTIRVDSRVGLGTTFTMRFPISVDTLRPE